MCTRPSPVNNNGLSHENTPPPPPEKKKNILGRDLTGTVKSKVLQRFMLPRGLNMLLRYS